MPSLRDARNTNGNMCVLYQRIVLLSQRLKLIKCETQTMEKKAARSRIAKVRLFIAIEKLINAACLNTED